MSDLSRREINNLMFGGLASVTVVTGTGCVPLLLRLVLGRSAVTRLGAAVRSSRLASGLVFGRGLSLGARIGRTRVSGLPKTQIVDKQGRVVATSESSNRGASVSVNGSKVFYSRDTDYGQEHQSFGPAGRSINVDKNTVRHEDSDGRRLGYDHIRLAKNIVDHYDSNDRKIGETNISFSDDNAFVSPDEDTLRSIEAIEKYLGIDCPESRESYQKLTELRQRCGKDDESACKQARLFASRSEFLQRQCRQYKK